MISDGTIVEVFEDPKTRQKKEGNARVIAHVCELDPGVNQYLVNFVGDDAEMVVTRTIVDECCCFEVAGDNHKCLVHVKVSHVAS